MRCSYPADEVKKILGQIATKWLDKLDEASARAFA